MNQFRSQFKPLIGLVSTLRKQGETRGNCLFVAGMVSVSLVYVWEHVVFYLAAVWETVSNNSCERLSGILQTTRIPTYIISYIINLFKYRLPLFNHVLNIHCLRIVNISSCTYEHIRILVRVWNVKSFIE